MGSVDSAMTPGAEVGDRQGGVGRAEVGRQHNPGVWIEGEAGWRPPAGRPGLTRGRDEPGRDEFVDAGSDRRTGEPGELREFGSGSAAAVPQELKKIS